MERAPLLATHRDLIKPDIIWNTELGLNATPERIGWAERERAAFYRRVAAFFETYDLLVTPGASTPAFDINRRMPEKIDGKVLITGIPTHMGTPSIAVPSGFDQYGRPLGLQLIGKPRGEHALLQSAALFEQATGLAARVPIDPRPGEVPPA